MSTQVEVSELAAQVRAVLAVVESGELPAESDQVAFLRGAAYALDVVAGQRHVSRLFPD